MSYEVKIDAFEGPIPLLLHLIKQEEVEIYDISIAEITTQYLDYIEAMQELDLEIASEFLIMAANLIEIKVKTLLPNQDDDSGDEEGDPRQQLIERLLEYKKYKDLADQLRSKEEEQTKRYTRELEAVLSEIDTEPPEVNPLDNISLQEFVATFEELLAAKDKEAEEKSEDEQKLSHINQEEFSIQDRMAELNQTLEYKKELDFARLFAGDSLRIEIVVTFMALLELMKLGKVEIRQTDIFGQIKVYALD
ncbi:MAG: segregation and condensation protein A [Bacillota bacterium]